MTNGSILSPFTDLRTALENPKLQDGHTIYLRQGTHKLTADTTIKASGITVKPYPGEEASICFYSRDGWKKIAIEGDQVRFRHLRIWSDPPHRTMQERFDRANNHCGYITITGDAPDDGLFADCRIHDVYSVQWWTGARGGALYKDCDLLNVGMDCLPGPNYSTDGEFLYTQNLPDAPMKYLYNSIFGPCYSVAFQIYSETQYAHHYRFQDLIFCQSGQLWHSGAPRTDDIVYERALRLNTSYVARDTVAMGDIPTSANAPTVAVNACTTEGAKRIAHIGIYNPTKLDTVSADVTALDLTQGATYRLRNALDPLIDTETLAYDGSGAISIGMADRSVAAPIGADAPLKAWDKRYGAFILERT